MSELPMSELPFSALARPVPLPPRLTVIDAPLHLASYFLAASETNGCRAVEPEAVMLPCIQEYVPGVPRPEVALLLLLPFVAAGVLLLPQAEIKTPSAITTIRMSATRHCFNIDSPKLPQNEFNNFVNGL